MLEEPEPEPAPEPEPEPVPAAVAVAFMPAVADDMAELTMVRAGALQGVVGTSDRVTMSSAVDVTFGQELQTTVVLTLELATAREAITTGVRQSSDLWFACK